MRLQGKKKDMSTIPNVFEAKKSGRIKGRGCADGQKQRGFITKEESSAPTISTEALFLTCKIDALKKRYIATTDIPGAFMQAGMDENVNMEIEEKWLN